MEEESGGRPSAFDMADPRVRERFFLFGQHAARHIAAHDPA